MTRAKWISLLGLLSFVAGFFLLGASRSLSTVTELIGSIGGLALLSLGALTAVRVRCGSCGRTVSSMFPAGSVWVLWTANQRCRNCGEYL
jgi:hypothetical protein